MKTLQIYEAKGIEFKCIPNFEGLYKISTCGMVYNVKKDSIIKPHFSGVPRRNYYQVTLYKGSLKFTKRVHSLMAITYLNHAYGNRKIVVDHIDNNPLNNRLDNLQIIDIRTNNIKDKKNETTK